MFPQLFSPLSIGRRLTLKNRIVMAPMGTNFADVGGYVSERNKLYYRTRAEGGAGLIIVEAVYVDAGQRHRPRGIRLSDDGFIAGLAGLADAVHGCGAAIFQQLHHPGRLSSFKASGVQPVSASPVPHPITGEIPHALSPDEIADVEELYAKAALRVKQAGFDGVEIHGGHGYLLASFVSPRTNLRTDRYGGSLENRMRFPLETVARVRRAVGPDFPISFRLSATEFLPGGFELDEAKSFAMELERAGVDLLHVSAGTNEQPRTMARCIPLGYEPTACFAHLAAAVRAVVEVPVVAVGRINSPGIAERILAEGQADLIAVGRAFIADPYWPAKAKAGEIDDINKCVACNEGCIERLNRGESICCTVNPWVGSPREVRAAPRPAPARRKSVMVIGGGPAGMKAAEEIARNGHRVTLCEKGDALGGQVRLASAPPGKRQLIDLVNVLECRLRALGVTIELNRDLSEPDIAACGADAIVFATGSEPALPRIEGIGSSRVVCADDVLAGSVDWTGASRFVVIGGGMVGLETAHLLASQGKTVTVVEIASAPGANCIPTDLATLLDRLEEQRVAILLDTEVSGIGEDGTVRIFRKDLSRAETLAGIDRVIVAAGRNSRQPFAALGVPNEVETYAVGDCRAPRKIMDAIREGAEVAAALDGAGEAPAAYRLGP